MCCDPLSSSTSVVSPENVSTIRNHAPEAAKCAWADVRSSLTGGGSDLGCEIGFLLLDALTECVADEPSDLDRPTRFALGFTQRLRDAFLVVENERLLQQANFLVKCLQPRLDDLFYYVSRFALLLELVGQHIPLALHNCRIERQRVECKRVCRCNVHGDLPADCRQLVGFSVGFESDDYANFAQPIGDCIVHIGAD